MAEVAIQTSGMKTLHPRARILHILDDELVSSETVAVIELVKNAYDADATRVLVTGREKAEWVLLTRCLLLTEQTEYQKWQT